MPAQRPAGALQCAVRRDHQGLDPGAPGERYQVVVHVDAPALADPDQPGQSVLEDGPRVPAETSRRLACDASRVVMRHDAEGRLLEVGARTRTIPPAVRRALQHRDRGCRFPGCGVRVGQGHFPSRPSGRVTSRRGFASTRGRRAPAGSGSAWISAGRSTSCTLWPRDRDLVLHPNGDRRPPVVQRSGAQAVRSTDADLFPRAGRRTSRRISRLDNPGPPV